MGRFIANVLGMIIAFAIGSAVFGVNPTTGEIVLVVVAWLVGDFVEGLIFGVR